MKCGESYLSEHLRDELGVGAKHGQRAVELRHLLQEQVERLLGLNRRLQLAGYAACATCDAEEGLVLNCRILFLN